MPTSRILAARLPLYRVANQPTWAQAKLAGQWGVKYAAVASHAAAQGRQRLAALLLDHERCAAEQVPLLLELGECVRGALLPLDGTSVHSCHRTGLLRPMPRSPHPYPPPHPLPPWAGACPGALLCPFP